MHDFKAQEVSVGRIANLREILRIDFPVQAFDSRLFALGGAQSHRFVPVKVADSNQTSFHQQQQQHVVQKQARPPLLQNSHFSQGEAFLTLVR